MTDATRAEINRYIETHARGRHGKVIYDLEGDFTPEATKTRKRQRANSSKSAGA